MARKITDFNAFNPITSDYPYGDIKDDSGTNDGTNMNRNTFADIFQFFAKMMDASSTSYNDIPDNAYSGFQFFNSLIQTIKQEIQALWITDVGTYTGSAGDITTTLSTFIILTPSTTLNSTLLRISANGNYGPSAVGETVNFFLYKNGTLLETCTKGSVTAGGLGVLDHFSIETKVAYTAGDQIKLLASTSANNATFTGVVTLFCDGFGF